MSKLRTRVIIIALLALVVLGGWWGWGAFMHPENKVAACTTQSLSTLTTTQVQVRVYNAGTVAGRASEVASILKSLGFVISSTGNAAPAADSNSSSQSDQDAVLTAAASSSVTITGASTDDPEVNLVAGYFPGATIVADGRADHRVDITVTDSSAMPDQTAARSVPVPSGEVCLPAASSSS